MSSYTCCECGKEADDDIEVDGTGRTACSKECKQKLLGANLPEGKRQGWYCRTHGKAA